MKKTTTFLLSLLLLTQIAYAKPSTPTLFNGANVQESYAADSSNANVTVISRTDGFITRVVGYDIMAAAADGVHIQCGSQVKAGYHFGDTSGIARVLYPLAIQCRDNSRILTGTIYTLDNDVTFTADDTADTITLSATTGIVAGHPMVFKSTTTLPAGLTAGTTYYYGLNTTKLYTTSSDAITDDGSTNIIDITNTGTGTHSLNGAYVHGTSTTTFSTDFGALDTIVIDGTAFTVSSVSSSTKAILSTANTADSDSALEYYRGSDNVYVIKDTAGTDLESTFWFVKDIE